MKLLFRIDISFCLDRSSIIVIGRHKHRRRFSLKMYFGKMFLDEIH